MEKEKFEIWVMEYLSDELGEKEKKAFEKFLKSHPEHMKQFDGLNETWSHMGSCKILRPSPEMDIRFYEMLYSEVDELQKLQKSRQGWFSKFMKNLWRPQVAYGMLLLVIGLSAGYLLKSNSPSSDNLKTTVVADQETEAVREKLVLTLLKQPSANKRLQGIGEVSKISKVDKKVIDALLRTLNNDANVNVRLAAIESLTNYLDTPKVREGLVESIVRQDAPIVQVTLANLMVALQEKKSVAPFKKLIQTKELDKSVKQKLETSINSII